LAEVGLVQHHVYQPLEAGLVIAELTGDLEEHGLLSRMEVPVRPCCDDEINQQHLFQVLGLTADRHEAPVDRPDVETLVSPFPEPCNRVPAMGSRHGELLHEQLGVGDLVR